MNGITLISVLIFVVVLLLSTRLSERLVHWLLSGRGRSGNARRPGKT